MRLLVTAGGTREPIDSVRVIANTSTGRLGARIADEAVAAGHEVLLLHATQAALPSRPCRRVSFETHADLGRLLEQHAPQADAIVQAAAVADYVPVASTGKLPSDLPELVLRLRRAPKLIDGLRALCPKAWLVGFKLTSGVDQDEQVAAAQALLVRARLDLVVVNDSARTDEIDHEALVVDASGIVARCRGKAALAQQLVARLPAAHKAAASGRTPA
ncbi:MAG TPA: phosphopantothenoylcysteine decarboxylase [Candidatus Limnocylindrales bacterium]|nr:phosphopantothenoylcysteine decarboxylase [Candidatus Limnocylindrales bacterium]